jgi:transposase InsO family protein
MGPLPLTKRRFQFIVNVTDYLTKFAEVQALKTFVKDEVARYIYKRIRTHFGIPLKLFSDQGPQFTSGVVKNLVASLDVKHQFTTTYKPSTNGLVERTNNTLCLIITKEAKTRTNV